MNETENLPRGWALATLGEVCSHPQYGWTTPATSQGDVKYLRTTDISSGKINWETVPFCVEAPEDLSKYRVKENDILVSRAGSVGLSVRVTHTPPYETAFASYLIRFNPLEEIEPQWVEHYLKTHQYWQAIDEASVGNALPNVNATKLAALNLPIPPLNEQRRIVAKLDRVLEKVEACRARLDTIPVTLKRFRQSVLAAACSGRLTADWREKNPDVDEWQTIPAHEACNSIQSGSTPKQGFQFDDGVPFLKVYNIVNQNINFEYKPQFVDQILHNGSLKRSIVKPGDVLMNIVGPPLGKVAIVPNTYEEWNINQAIVLFRPKPSLDAQFLYFLLCSGVSYADVLQETRGSAGQANISLSQCRAMDFFLPPLEEQREIVRRVQELFAWSDSIEARYRKARGHFDKVAQATLAKAFRGELVPQDPNDEPASELLRRIREERAASENGTSSTRKARGRVKSAALVLPEME